MPALSEEMEKRSHLDITSKIYRENFRREVESDDFYMQKCKKCEKGSTILSYGPLDRGSLDESKEIKPHEMELCAKCMSGEPCVDRLWT